MRAQKKIIIIAGPNGAGKTTFAKEYLPKEADCPIFVNADLIAAGIAPENPEAVAVRAGRMMLEKLDALTAAGESFAFETTLSGRAYARKIKQWRAGGYYVALNFLSLKDPETAVKRVASRVRLGGHHIPESAVHRRFHAGLANLREIYCNCVDIWRLFDNTDGMILLEEGQNDEIA